MGRKSKTSAAGPFEEGAWEPTADMRNFLRAWKENLTFTVAEVLESCGLSLSWYYDKFQNDPLAQKWFRAERESMFAGEAVAEVHKAVYARAMSPDNYQHHHAKLFLQRFDPEFRERKEVHKTLDVRLRGSLSVEDRLKYLTKRQAEAKGLPAPAAPAAGAAEEFAGEVVAERVGEVSQ